MKSDHFNEPREPKGTILFLLLVSKRKRKRGRVRRECDNEWSERGKEKKEINK
jgi:hypothetical protein